MAGIYRQSKVNPLTNVIYADVGTTSTNQNGSIASPYSSLQAAIDTIPAATTAAGSETVYVVRIAPGNYDEDVNINLSNKRIVLLGFGPWGVGQFHGSNYAPSGTARNITVTLDTTSVSTIRSCLYLGTALQHAEAFSTHLAYMTSLRVSGKLVVNNSTSSTAEIYASGQFFGTPTSIDTTGSTGNGLINLYLFHSRLNGALTGTDATRLQIAERTKFDGAVSLKGYSIVSGCSLAAGMTVTASLTDLEPAGMFMTNLAGTFTGPASSLRLDGYTNYRFVANSGVLAGGATKTIMNNVT